MAAAKFTEKQGRPEGVSITIKTGKGYEDTWLGFTGTVEEVRANLKATFELDDTDLTLFELVQNATQAAHGVTRAVSALKGTVVPAPAAPKRDDGIQGPTASQTGDEAQSARPDAWAEAEAGQGKEVDPYAALLNDIASQTDARELKKLYPPNKELFTADTDEGKAALKAWQEKGKALNKKT